MKQDPPQVDPYLIQNAIAGDRSALESLLVYFHDPLLHYIRGRCVRHGLTGLGEDDVLQESLLEAFRQVQSIQAQGSTAFFAWLKTIARTRMINMVKAQKAQKRGGHFKQVHTPPSDATVTTIINLFAGKVPTPSRIVRNKEMIQGLDQALAGLSPNRRQVMELRFGKGLSVEEIGVRMGLAEGAVKMYIHRSLKELRQVFQEYSSLGQSRA